MGLIDVVLLCFLPDKLNYENDPLFDVVLKIKNKNKNSNFILEQAYTVYASYKNLKSKVQGKRLEG